MTDLVVGHAPPERAGAASALSETCGELGGALGIAVLGTVGGAFYRSHMAGLALPRADEALDTLSGALEAARALPPREASELVEQARAAFAGGMHEAMLIASLVAPASALLVYLRLGRSRSPGAPAQAERAVACLNP
jgi:DHA2 family multidrug resistance protein-like MFS transporter